MSARRRHRGGIKAAKERIMTASEMMTKTALCRQAMREARQAQGLTLKQVAYKMGISSPQVQRVESGARRLTIQFLQDYCDAININILDLFSPLIAVPVIGVIGADANINPVAAGMDTWVRAPHIVCHPERLASVRWGANAPFKAMEGHIGFFYADTHGIPDTAWRKACVMRRADGTHRLGSLVNVEGQIHVLGPAHEVELNAQIEWASPLLATIAPQVLR